MIKGVFRNEILKQKTEGGYYDYTDFQKFILTSLPTCFTNEIVNNCMLMINLGM